MYLGILLVVFSAFFGFCSHAAAKDKKPASVEEYDETTYSRLHVDKDNRLYHIYLTEDGRIEKRYVGSDNKKQDKVEINVPSDNFNFYLIKYDGATNNIFFCDESDIMHYYDSKGKDIASFSLRDIWKKTKKRSYIWFEDIKRRNNRICVIAGKGYNNTNRVYAEYDIRAKKITKKQKLKIDGNVEQLRMYGDKYIYGIRKTGSVQVSGNKITDGRKHSVVVYDYTGRLRYEMDYTHLMTNYTDEGYYEIFGNYRYNEGRQALENHVDNLYDVRDGYVYVATRKGIYKCKTGKKHFKKMVDLSSCEFCDTKNYIASFKYIDKDKYGFSVGIDNYVDNFRDMIYIVKGVK